MCMDKKRVCETICGEYMGNDVCQNALKECEVSLDDVKKEIATTDKTLLDCRNEREGIYKDLQVCRKDQTDAITAMQKAQNELQSYKQVNAERDRLNSEYTKTQLVYANKRFITNTYNDKVWIPYDVKDYVYASDTGLKNLGSTITSIYNPPNEESFVRAVVSWVANNHVLYELDSYQHGGVDDFWQFAPETLQLGKGDCEDQTFTTLSILRCSGIPSYKLRADLGIVYGKYGHCYGQYWNSSDWILLENTMPWKYTTPLETIASHPEYHTYWSFNDEYTWEVDGSVQFGLLINKMMDIKSREWAYKRWSNQKV